MLICHNTGLQKKHDPNCYVPFAVLLECVVHITLGY